MLLAHAGRRPHVDRTAWIAPDATLCGDVSVGAGSRIMHGARIVGEGGGAVRIGRGCIVLENAVVRATGRHDCTIGDHCLVGPGAHLVGAQLENQVFVATGAAVFHGARLGCGAEVRVHATVHLKTRLLPGTTVPIGWVAVGDPASILPPDRHDEIWAVQAPLDFPQWVYGSTVTHRTSWSTSRAASRNRSDSMNATRNAGVAELTTARAATTAGLTHSSAGAGASSGRVIWPEADYGVIASFEIA